MSAAGTIQPYLLAVSTPVPPHVVEQDAAAAAAAEVFEGKVFRTPDLLALFANTGV